MINGIPFICGYNVIDITVNIDNRSFMIHGRHGEITNIGMNIR